MQSCFCFCDTEKDNCCWGSNNFNPLQLASKIGANSQQRTYMIQITISFIEGEVFCSVFAALDETHCVVDVGDP